MGHALRVPELPDVTVYVERLAAHCVGQTLERVRITGPSLLRSVDPPLSAAEGRRVIGVRRLGKRIVFELEDELFLVFHLMIAGRFRWRERGARAGGKRGLATLDFATGTLVLTEASTQKRASLHVVRGEAGAARARPGRARSARCDRSKNSARGCAPRTTRSSARSRIRTSSPGSATRTRTRSCTARGSRRWRSRAALRRGARASTPPTRETLANGPRGCASRSARDSPRR